MSPTLADVYMITGLDITGSVQPWNFKVSSRQTGVKPGNGYKNYILKHMKDNLLGDVEYRVSGTALGVPLNNGENLT
jgi:hypothetical protein